MTCKVTPNGDNNYLHPLYSMPDDTIDTFPIISEYTNIKFKSEISALTSIWSNIEKNLNDNETKEREYKERCCFMTYKTKLAYSVFTVLTATAGAVCAFTGAYFENYSILPTTLNTVPMYMEMGGLVIFTVFSFATILPGRIQGPKLEEFTSQTSKLTNLQTRIKDCVKLLNEVTGLYSVWQETKLFPSLDNMNRLFSHFANVQQAESGITSQTINKIENLRLMDKLCECVNKEHSEDKTILKKWKEFTSKPTIDLTLISDDIDLLEDLDPPDDLDPIDFPAVKASIETYKEFFMNRDSNQECPIDAKITLLRDSIKKGLTLNNETLRSHST